jgi:CheY-like chemotaxis protein
MSQSAPPVPIAPVLLVVDDEEDLRDVIRYHFTRRGYQVIEAGCAVEALRLLRERPVDVVISDMRMPGGDGTEILRTARALEPPVPVILISGYYPSDDEPLRSDGAAAVLAKPCPKEEMFEAVRRALLDRNLT